MRTFLLYTVIVGLPVIGIVTVLESGADLRAAPGVAGTWTVVSQPLPPSQDCAETASVQPLKTLAIQQSGPMVTIALPDDGGRELTGRIEWGSETPARVNASGDASAGTQNLTHVTALTAAFTRVDGQRTLEGTLHIRVCDAVRQQPFRATHQRAGGGN